MRTKRRIPFTTVRTEGAILPADLLQRVVDRDGSLEGLKPETYHLADETLNEAVNNAWNRLTEKWRKFREVLSKLPETNPAMADTRDRWLLPLFDGLGYGRLLSSKPVTIEGKSYPLSHSWGNAPIHLVGYRVELDRRQTGPAGSDRTSPHGMLQELLNRSEQYLWGFVSNGRRLRILRDNVSLTRQAFVEFDVETMMEGGVYADFALLWLLCHQSRVESERPQDCWLERWSHAAQEQGTRALDQLRNGVEQAITALGRGFLSHRENPVLREALRSGRLVKQDYFRQLLRMVYRLIFLFVAEDRGLLHGPGANKATTDLYGKFYSTARVRKLAELRTGSRHGDLFAMLRLVMRKLGHDQGCPELGLSPLDSFLWSDEAMPDLIDAQISNRDLLDAFRSLCFTVDANVLRPVDFKNLGTEELGSVYESLLELHPELEADAGTFRLATAGGHERKTSGTYYTPPQLVRCLLDSALEPVLIEAASKPDPEKAILDIKVCDPACGSGHFLISAGHRIAKKLASVRIGDNEPSAEEVRKALRDVIGRCLYGVDINPMTVELCKVSLWMEAVVPGKPLSFLEHHIREGNSLLGTTPGLLRRGIPDEAFEPIEGDDKTVCRDYRKRNKSQRLGQEEMFDAFDGKPWERQGNLAATMRNVDQMPDETLEQIRAKERAYQETIRGGPYASNRLLADSWCAAFVWKKSKENHPDGFLEPITQATFQLLAENPHKIPEASRQEIRRLSEQYRFFHWHLAFSDVFSLPDRIPHDDLKGWTGGFDVVLGNPPWERIKIQEQEWFAERRPDIAKAPNASARRKMIRELAEEDPSLHQSFLDDRRLAEGESHLVRSSGRFPLCGRGDINTYSVFAELDRQLIAVEGRLGCIVPSGISSDDTTKAFFQDMIRSRTLVCLYSFENEEFIFPAVDHRVRFSLVTVTGPDRPQPAADFVYFARRTEHLQEPDRHFSLSDADFSLMNPNSGTCPSFRSKRDAEINKSVYRNVPVLVREGQPDDNPWGISFMVMLHMANDSGLFRTREELEDEGWFLNGNMFSRAKTSYVPMIEAKMVHHFDHRFGTYAGQTDSQANQGKLPELDDAQHADPNKIAQPWYWVPADEVEERLKDRWDRQWLLGWRDICRNTDQRTVLASLLPKAGIGHTFPLALPKVDDPRLIALLYANLTTFVLDYVARQKIGGTHVTYSLLKQFPILPPVMYDERAKWALDMNLRDWLLPRVLELTYTAWDLEPFAQDCGHQGPPFIWDEKRRHILRSEIDAAYFLLYGIERDDLAYILESFPVVKKKDEAKHGMFRTQKSILAIYDRMTEAISGGQSYRTLLEPSPADPSVAHSLRMQS